MSTDPNAARKALDRAETLIFDDDMPRTAIVTLVEAVRALIPEPATEPAWTSQPGSQTRTSTGAPAANASIEDDLLNVIDSPDLVGELPGWHSGHSLTVTRAILAAGYQHVGDDEVVVRRDLLRSAVYLAETDGTLKHYHDLRTALNPRPTS